MAPPSSHRISSQHRLSGLQDLLPSDAAINIEKNTSSEYIYSGVVVLLVRYSGTAVRVIYVDYVLHSHLMGRRVIVPTPPLSPPPPFRISHWRLLMPPPN